MKSVVKNKPRIDP